MPEKENGICKCNSHTNDTQVPFESILLQRMAAMFANLSDEIKITISSDGNTLTAENISEECIILIELITNDHSNNNKLKLKDIKVYSEYNCNVIPVLGLLPILQRRVTKSDFIAYKENKRTYYPLKQLFNNRPFSNFVDELSSISGETRSTKGVKKRYGMTFVTCYGDECIGGTPW